MSIPSKPPIEPADGGIYPQHGNAGFAPIPQEQNYWGLSGLIFSVLGIVACGLFCPIGLLLSLIGLLKAPRGLAIAGLIVGLIGTIFFAFVGVFVIGTIMAAMGLIAATSQAIEHAQSYTPMFEAQKTLAFGWDGQDGLPDEQEGNQLIEGELDLWGKQIRYERVGDKYRLRSAGKDTDFDTEDDILLGSFDRVFAPQFDASDPAAYPDEMIEKLPPGLRESFRKAKEQSKKLEENPFDDDHSTRGSDREGAEARSSAEAQAGEQDE